MHTFRIPIAGLAGALFTASMFWMLWTLVEPSFGIAERIEAPRVEFSAIHRDTEVVTRRRERIEREPPPPTPETPRIGSTDGGVDNHVARVLPIVDTGGARSRITMAAGSDRDVIPLVRVKPDYPQSALRRELEGWVRVQFTITAAGGVKDAVVVDAEPKGVFDDAALKAIVRWRYNPKVENGAAVERVGVQTRILFRLDQQ
jgi:periplasmic protein TonB